MCFPLTCGKDSILEVFVLGTVLGLWPLLINGKWIVEGLTEPTVLPCPGAFTHRVEVLDASGLKCPRHSLGCGHTGYGVAVANGLAHGDNVGDEVFSLELEGPEVLAYTAKAHLNLICDKDPSGLVDVPVAEDKWLTGGGLQEEGSGQELGGLGTLKLGSASIKVGPLGGWLPSRDHCFFRGLAKNSDRQARLRFEFGTKAGKPITSSPSQLLTLPLLESSQPGEQSALPRWAETQRRMLQSVGETGTGHSSVEGWSGKLCVSC